MNLADKDILSLIGKQIDDIETLNNFGLCNKITYKIFKDIDKNICKNPSFSYKTLEDALNNIYYFVEADSFKLHSLWYMYSHKPVGKKIPWKDIGLGFWESIGITTVGFYFSYIYGKLVCFYYPSSMKIDWGEIYDFLRPYWTKNDGRKRQTDPNNFQLCYIECRKINK